MQLFEVETNHVWLDGGSMFGNTPRAVWEKWFVPDKRNRIQLACRALLAKTDQGHNILFEAGCGPFFEPKLKDRYGIEEEHQLLLSLQRLGLDEKDIHAIVLSHLHFDHAGGLLSSYQSHENTRLLFPNAKFYVGKEHWNYAQQPHIREKASFIPHLHSLLKDSGRFVLIDGSHHSDLPFVQFHLSYGHTIGLMVSEIELPSGPLIYGSDIVPGQAWLHLPTSMGYDRFAELIVDEKRKLLERLAAKHGYLFFSHDPQVACVHISVNESGKYVGNSANIDNLFF